MPFELRTVFRPKGSQNVMRECTTEEKKAYLALYPMQIVKIRRYNILKMLNADKKDEYRLLIEKAVFIRDMIERDIEKLEDITDCELLAQKYLCEKSVEEISKELNYSKRQTERRLTKAISRFSPTGMFIS